jgi:hypothetical protein
MIGEMVAEVFVENILCNYFLIFGVERFNAHN